MVQILIRWFVMAALVIAGHRPQSPVPTPTTTASITGTVISDRTGTPIRHAQVTLSRADGEQPAQMNTDDDGRFRFAALEAGRYGLHGAAPGFLRYENRAAKAGDDVVIRMTPGAIITGRVVDPMGEPAGHVAVSLQKWAVNGTGERSLTYQPVVKVDSEGSTSARRGTTLRPWRWASASGHGRRRCGWRRRSCRRPRVIRSTAD